MFKTKRTRAINACLAEIVNNPPMAWMLISPSIGHVATTLQKRLKEQGIEISFIAACQKVERYKQKIRVQP